MTPFVTKESLEYCRIYNGPITEILEPKNTRIRSKEAQAAKQKDLDYLFRRSKWNNVAYDELPSDAT